MANKQITQSNQQRKRETSQESGILQRAAVRLVSDAGMQSTEDKEAQPLSNSVFSKDFSRVPISTTKPQQIMAKLMIGPVGDKYEQEADRVAAQVAQRINTPASVRSGEGETVQRQEMETKDNEARLMRSPILQRKSNDGEMAATTDLEASINRARGGGQPMANNIRQPMEKAFGADFSGVKVYTNSQSDQLNRSIQARAFTTGQDVFFRQGEYNPGSRGGQELSAHELTHVVQQKGTVGRRVKEAYFPELQKFTAEKRIMRAITSVKKEEISQRISNLNINLNQLANQYGFSELDEEVEKLDIRKEEAKRLLAAYLILFQEAEELGNIVINTEEKDRIEVLKLLNKTLVEKTQVIEVISPRMMEEMKEDPNALVTHLKYGKQILDSLKKMKIGSELIVSNLFDHDKSYVRSLNYVGDVLTANVARQEVRDIRERLTEHKRKLENQGNNLSELDVWTLIPMYLFEDKTIESFEDLKNKYWNQIEEVYPDQAKAMYEELS